MVECLYLVFIDLVKAFDTVNREKLYEILRIQGIDRKMRDMVKSIHTTPFGEITARERFAVMRGVRQGCVLGPFLFTLIFDEICRRALNCEGSETDSIDHLAYADDLVLISRSESEVQEKLRRLEGVISDFGMEILVKKTKCLVIGNSDENAFA